MHCGGIYCHCFLRRDVRPVLQVVVLPLLFCLQIEPGEAAQVLLHTVLSTVAPRRIRSRCSGQCWSTSQPWPSHIEGSYSLWALAVQGPSGMLAFQQRQASLRCCRIVRALFCLIPSGIMSRISCITAARSSRSKCDSTLCFVTVFATPLSVDLQTAGPGGCPAIAPTKG